MAARAWLLTGFLLAGGAAVGAQERILAYDVEVDVHADGSLTVAEHITVRAEGRQIRRGIYRDVPTRYRDRHGNRVVAGFEVIGVERDGVREEWFTERVGNGVRLNTGGDVFLRVPAEYRLTLRYRITRQLGFFDDHDELYWNAIGTGWVFPIDSARVEVRLPAPVPVERMGVEAYTGPQGARGSAYVAEVAAPGVARYRLTGPLGPYEGLTVVLTFPKGVITAPTRAQRGWWLLQDNAGLLVALAGLGVLLLFCAREWRRVGRDPRAGPVVARYDPPEGLTPAAARFVRRMGYDMRCLSADVLALAVGGYLRIERDEGWLLKKERWALERLETAGPPADAAQRALMAGLFRGDLQRVELQQSQAPRLQAGREAHRKALDARFHGQAFTRNTPSVIAAVGIAGLSFALAFLVSGGAGTLAITGVALAAGLALVAFAAVVRAPTPDGRRLMDAIEGLRLYLSVAERDELALLRGPGMPPVLDAARYEMLLPFAVALEVEEAWTTKFTAAVGAAAAEQAARGIAWYQGGRGPITDLHGLGRTLTSNFTSQIAAASAPPGSRSGSRGGGSSGGGGGGGGGGGR